MHENTDSGIILLSLGERSHFLPQHITKHAADAASAKVKASVA